MKLETFFKQHKVFIFAGNGGTGKTTLSATFAMEAAHSGFRVGLVTIDPSRRLGETFSMDITQDEYKRQPVGDKYIDIHLIQSAKIIREFISKEFSQSKYEELIKNSLFRQVVTRLAENQSLSTIYKLAEIMKSSEYDLVVVDTPPVGHTLDFFQSPDSTIHLFKENILAQTVLTGDGVALRATKKVFTNILSLLVGREFVDQMEVFFSAFLSFQEKIVISAEFLREKLKEEEVCYFLISSPETQKVQELNEILLRLKKLGVKKSHLIINRAYPDWLGRQPALFADEWPVAKNYYDKLFNYYDNRKQQIQNFMSEQNKKTNTYFVPEKSYFTKDVSMDQLRQALRGAFYE
ncbi:AAA family ATPase [bacterium]|nr:AAA family ATPase [bacterium]